MTTPCTNNRLHLFVDGELSATEAEAFRQHLTRCAECESGLRDLLQLELLAARALGGAAPVAESPDVVEPVTAKVVPLRARLQKVYRTALPLAMAAGLATVFIRFQAPVEIPGEVWLSSADSRTFEARLSHPKADRFLPYSPMRGTSQATEMLPLRPLAELEERHDFRGIAAAYALRGDWQQAEAFLGREPESADKANDQAVVALSRQRYEEALGLLTSALRQNPNHAQALWNRALVLRERDLLDRAAASFDTVASLGEEGWSAEARRMAAELRTQLAEERVRWRRQVTDAWLTLTGDAPWDVKQLAQRPVVARAALYEAVRTVTSKEDVEALLPLAKELDTLGGGSVLQEYVRQVATKDFAARAPLAQGYAGLLRERETKKDATALLESLRRSGERDIYFGALVHTGSAVVDATALSALRGFAEGTPDPWLHLLAEREGIRRELAAGHTALAEKQLMDAMLTCNGLGNIVPCMELN
ncbi:MULTISPECIES: zf-HC2 domain-containing protein [Myxococcus]|uniref:zf-HC2 domain-containing protein n=1 Tax=Myxococcus TaxID=32 RepID=UPI0013D480C6|nr:MULTISPECIES: zf-HC2 domain-containing protein [Myxococcus]NVJ26135.1 zf-HC2 domain-containing protein [Myxococcus sp. AM011]